MTEKKKIANQGTMTDLHFERLQRPDLIYNRNQTTFQNCLNALTKPQRSTIDNDKLTALFRTHTYFKTQGDQFLNECCQLMQFEQYQKDTLLYSKNEVDCQKLIIVIQGELAIQIQNQELLTTRHWGSNLMILGSDCYAEMPELSVKCKTHCKLAVISKQDFKVNLLTQEISRITKEISQLYAFPIFKSLNYMIIRKFFANSFAQSFNCLDIIYTQESKAFQVYLVMNGIFEMRELHQGFAKQVNIYTPGQFIGDKEILYHQQMRQGTAFCISDEGELLLFDSRYFLEHMFPLVQPNLKQSDYSSIQSLNYKSQQLQQQQQQQQQQQPFKSQLKLPKKQRLNNDRPLTQQKYNLSRKASVVKLQESNEIAQHFQERSSSLDVQKFHHSKYQNIRNVQLLRKNQSQHLNQQHITSLSINRSRNSIYIQQNEQKNQQFNQINNNLRIVNRKAIGSLKIPLKNELLNKFLNQKDEYNSNQSSVTHNKLRRTVSQTNFPINQKSYFNSPK